MFEIEKGVPIPAAKPHHRYPFREMEVGDSFAVPLNGEGGSRAQARICNAARHYARDGREYRTHVTGDMVRVWRVK